MLGWRSGADPRHQRFPRRRVRCGILDGDLLSAIEEERFNRVKHWAGFPLHAIRHCAAGMLPDHVAVSRNP